MQKLMKCAAIGLLAILTGCDQPASGPTEGSQQHQEQRSDDLADLISSGAVSLVRASGNGSSSGNSINAVLQNNTGREIEVSVFMRRPIFLANRGAGQNMIASMIVGTDGSYMQSGERSIIALKPNAQFNASMVAYCADFDKDNPTESETFTVIQAPPNLEPVIARINDYVRANPNSDVTAAAQVAIWIAQNQSPYEIAEKFEFTPADEQLAYQFLR